MRPASSIPRGDTAPIRTAPEASNNQADRSHSCSDVASGDWPQSGVELGYHLAADHRARDVPSAHIAYLL